VPYDLTKQRPRDPNRVNIHDHEDVENWCRQIGCTRAQLIVAVHSVGPRLDAVCSFLREVAPPAKLSMIPVRNPLPPAGPEPPPATHG
jgi:hypothetical protein